MKRFQLLAPVVLAFLALAATMAATASALLENLPEAVRSTPGESVGATKFETVGKLSIECASATSTGEETGSKPPKGTFHIMFKECVAKLGIIKGKCTGLGETNAGDILALGTWNLVFDHLGTGTELKTAILFTIEPVHFECVGIQLDIVHGQVLCLHLNPTESSKSHEFHCLQTNGKPEETKYWNAAGTETAIETLTTVVNETTSEESAQQWLGKINTTGAILADQ